MSDQEGKEYVLQAAKEQDVKFIRAWFTDVLGTLKSVAITVEELETALEEGIGFDGSSIEGFARIDESDMVAMPDPSTFVVLPWRPRDRKRVARIFCDILQPSGEPFEGDPRYILKRNLNRAADLGFTFYVGPELEYFYFANSETPTTLDRGGYFDLTPLDAATDLRRETVLALEEMGITVEASHHEGAPSQHEIDLRYTDALTMADKVMWYKYIVKNVARKHGKVATFMPKPLFGDNGSGMHCHVSLWKNGTNIFYDPEGYALISDTARYFIGGLLKHARALMAFCAPTTNSYKRLVPGYEAPVNLVYSARNRSAAVRIPVYTSNPKTKRLEFRPPDATANPYLAFSAMLMAGLDGVENEIDPGPPLDKNTYELSPEEEHSVPTVPNSLEEALDALEEDHDFLTNKGVFTSDVLDVWLEYKRENEVDPVRLRPHPWEFYLYFDV